jgi:hypothetical protein
MLGGSENDHWSIAVPDPAAHISHKYRGNMLILDTDIETNDGSTVTQLDDGSRKAIADPDMVVLRTSAPIEAEGASDTVEVLPLARRSALFLCLVTVPPIGRCRKLSIH